MEVNSRSILCLLAKRFGLKRSTTQERLKLQKLVYLLQEHGMKLGYGYVWYKHGPYSQDLVFDSYAVLTAEQSMYNEETAEWKFSKNTEAKLSEFKQKYESILGDADQLELEASVCFLRLREDFDGDEEEFVKHFWNRKPQLFSGNKPSKEQVLEALQRASSACAR